MTAMTEYTNKKQKRIFAWVPVLTHKRVKIASARLGVDMQEIIKMAVEKWLDSQEAKGE